MDFARRRFSTLLAIAFAFAVILYAHTSFAIIAEITLHAILTKPVEN